MLMLVCVLRGLGSSPVSAQPLLSSCLLPPPHFFFFSCYFLKLKGSARRESKSLGLLSIEVLSRTAWHPVCI